MANKCSQSEHSGNCPCMGTCPLSRVMDKIGGKWKIRILCALMKDGPTRYNTLKRKVDGITNTMLAGSLKELEKDELVLRKEFLEVPVRVEYSATDACKNLMPVLEQLARWEITTFSP